MAATNLYPVGVLRGTGARALIVLADPVERDRNVLRPHSTDRPQLKGVLVIGVARHAGIVAHEVTISECGPPRGDEAVRRRDVLEDDVTVTLAGVHLNVQVALPRDDERVVKGWDQGGAACRA